jgi:hypothetical protein
MITAFLIVTYPSRWCRSPKVTNTRLLVDHIESSVGGGCTQITLCTNEVAKDVIITSFILLLCEGSSSLSSGWFIYWKGQDVSINRVVGGINIPKGLFGYFQSIWIEGDGYGLGGILTYQGLKPPQSLSIHMDWGRTEQALRDETSCYNPTHNFFGTPYKFDANFSTIPDMSVPL